MIKKSILLWFAGWISAPWAHTDYFLLVLGTACQEHRRDWLCCLNWTIALLSGFVVSHRLETGLFWSSTDSH